MGLLEPKQLEDWRRGRVPYLERVINCNLTRLSRLLRIKSASWPLSRQRRGRLSRVATLFPSRVAPAPSAVLAALILAACSLGAQEPPSGEPAPEAARQELQAAPPSPPAKPRAGGQPGSSQRRVIRRAELTVEAEDPPAAQRRATALADSAGGYVETSEVVQQGPHGSSDQRISLVLRVPEARFTPTLDELRRLGSRVTREKIGGEDVTDQLLDLGARLKTQRALEEKLLEVLGQATTVKDALEVHRHLAEVRTQIEKLDAQLSGLEARVSMTTIALTILERAPILTATGFGFVESVHEAGRDAVQVGVEIINGSIRLVGVLLPVGLLLGAPGYFALRALRRRRAHRQTDSGGASGDQAGRAEPSG